MSQRLFLNKVAKYLDFSCTDEKNRPYVSELQQHLRGNGYCFALAVVDGAMEDLGKTRWWIALYCVILLWDEKKESLDEELKLPDATDTGKKTLAYHFDRITNYIVDTQCVGYEYDKFSFPGMNQRTLFQPDAHVIPTALKKWQKRVLRKQSYFEMVNDEGKIITSKHREYAVGYFSRKQLELLLSWRLLLGKLIFLYDSTHAIRVSYVNSFWIVFDANYEKSKKEKFYFIGNREEAITEIFRILGQTLTVEGVSFSDQEDSLFPHYDLMLSECPELLLNGDALKYFISYVPDKLLKILDQINASERGLAIKRAVAEALAREDVHGKNGFFWVLQRGIQFLSRLLNLIDETYEGGLIKDALIKALFMRNAITRESGLCLVCCRYPQYIDRIFELLKPFFVHVEFYNNFFKALSLRDGYGRSAIVGIVSYNPVYLSFIMEQCGSLLNVIDLMLIKNEKNIFVLIEIEKTISEKLKEQVIGVFKKLIKKATLEELEKVSQLLAIMSDEEKQSAFSGLFTAKLTLRDRIIRLITAECIEAKKEKNVRNTRVMAMPRLIEIKPRAGSFSI